MEQKNSYWKFVAAFLGIVVLGLAGFVASRIYGLRLEKRASDAALEALRKTADENYQKALTDTYGGKTPQETLRMYIAAVEKGDYVLASKYFVVEKQEGEASTLNNINQKNNLNEYVSYLRVAEPWQSSLEDTNFTMESKVSSSPSLFIRLTKYPSGIWKIIEI